MRGGEEEWGGGGGGMGKEEGWEEWMSEIACACKTAICSSVRPMTLPSSHVTTACGFCL